MSKKKYDTSEPILVIVRRGRKGRGFTVAPVEDASNPAMCGTIEELGEVLEEMLNDEYQSRVDLAAMLSAGMEGSESPRGRAPEEGEPEYDDGDEDEDEDEAEGGEEDGGLFEGVAGAADPADQLLINVFSWAAKKGQSMSSKPRAPRARTRRRRPSGKKRS